MDFKIKPQTNKKVISGRPEPLGATLEDGGVNFAIYSEYAQQIFLILFNAKEKETDVIELKKGQNNVWHVFVEDIKKEQLYGFRVNGEYNPAHGKRFNPHKLLIDPYAKALTGRCQNKDNLLFGYSINAPDKDLTIDTRDSKNAIPKSVVIKNDFDWQNDKQLNIPIEKLIIYETHLKGFTAHKSSKIKKSGTYLGFIEKIPYLKKLGINAVELLPIQAFYNREALVEKGLSEYWGYNTIGFFAPEPSYSTLQGHSASVNEFKNLVLELHKAKIEVIMDVVLNHTGEGSELGPTICFRGIDNPTYYTLAGNKEQPYRYCRNDTGCGNMTNVEHPQVVKLFIDSLRYWVEEMHIDGFRFDMASVLARLGGQYQKDSLFFKSISNDPILQKVKMIAEPWDLTTYKIGDFPLNWSEWNGKFRDTVRRFIKGDAGQLNDLAWRVTGSADLFGDDARSPYNSINFITCHDGYTLIDLFSYNDKHNEANKENNQDGLNENHSWNWGIEGETSDESIILLRKQLVKNALCHLMFSLGTPMIQGGDEFLRTQKGTNNAYCQDNETTWFDWNLIDKNADIIEFCKKAIDFRKKHTIISSKKFLLNIDGDGDGVPDIVWFGNNLDRPDWNNHENKVLAYLLDGSEEKSDLGNYHLFFILNSDHRAQITKLPQYINMKWFRVVDTSLSSKEDFLKSGHEKILAAQDQYKSNPRSVVVLLGK